MNTEKQRNHHSDLNKIQGNMDPALISQMRQTAVFMRSTAATVLVAFSLLILQPTIAAAQDALETDATVAQPDNANSAEQRLSKTLQRIESQLGRLQTKLDNQQDSSTERSELEQLKHALEQLDTEVSQNFSHIEQHILDHQLDSSILERHQAMVDNYREELAALLTELNGIETNTDNAGRKAHAKKAKDRLKAKRNKRSQQPFDPNQLPNSSLKPKPDNKPKQTPEAFAQAGLFDIPYTQVAALGDFTFDRLDGANNPAYLAETVEITLSQAIKEKAEQLNHDSVKIYHWVRNNVEWQPTWGGIQDADLTLSAQRGNAMDIAGLTIALLRASKIPARYVHGTIDVPAEAFKNWVGGFTDITAAADFASSSGIPTTVITSGGNITSVRIEHLWTEAAIDFQPSRGAKNLDADSWVQLDASYKQYDYLQGLDVLEISGIDPEQLAQSYIDSGTVNEEEGWVTGFDPAILQAAQEQAQQKLEIHIEENLSDPTVGDVIGGRKMIIKEYPVLPSGLPNQVIVAGSRYDKLPGALQQTITWALNRDISGNLIDPVSFPYAQVNNQKITLSFKPATEADEQALLSLLPEGEITDISQLPTSIPSHLVNVIPELKLNGEIIKTGTAMQLGEELPFTTATHFAGRGLVQSPRTYYVIAGSYLVVNAYGGSVSRQMLTTAQSRLEKTKTILENIDETQFSEITGQELLGDIFHAAGLGYYSQFTLLSQLLGQHASGSFTLAAGTGTIGYEPSVNYFFGFPSSIRLGGIVFDIPYVNINGVNDGNQEKKKEFTLLVGILSSALEHAVPEQIYVNEENPGDAISTVKALQKASQQGQKIYRITQATQSDILSHINHDQATMNEIRNALTAGKEVITHTYAVTVPGWSGAGYIIVDSQTGDGAYKISGGRNGSFFSGLSFGLAFSALFALSGKFIAWAQLTAGKGGLAAGAAIHGLLYTLAPVYIFNQEVYGDDPELWACWLTGFGIGGGLTPATATLLLELFPVAVLGFIGDIAFALIDGSVTDAIGCLRR